MNLASRSQVISFLIAFCFFSEASQLLFDGFRSRAHNECMLNQFTRDSQYLRRLPRKNILVVPKETSKHEFLFQIQVDLDVSYHGSVHGIYLNLLAEGGLRLQNHYLFLWRHEILNFSSVQGAHRKGLFQAIAFGPHNLGFGQATSFLVASVGLPHITFDGDNPLRT